MKITIVSSQVCVCVSGHTPQFPTPPIKKRSLRLFSVLAMFPGMMDSCHCVNKVRSVPPKGRGFLVCFFKPSGSWMRKTNTKLLFRNSWNFTAIEVSSQGKTCEIFRFWCSYYKWRVWDKQLKLTITTDWVCWTCCVEKHGESVADLQAVEQLWLHVQTSCFVRSSSVSVYMRHLSLWCVLY